MTSVIFEKKITLVVKKKKKNVHKTRTRMSPGKNAEEFGSKQGKVACTAKLK